MLQHYINLAIRNFVKHWRITVINLFGLTAGLLCIIFIGLYIIDELSYDCQHTKADQIYRVIENFKNADFEEHSSSCPFPFAPSLRQEYPEIVENVVRIYSYWGQNFNVKYENKLFAEDKFAFVDSTFFEIFNFNFIIGNPQKALYEPNCIVITESTATKYFGKTDAYGKILKVNDQYNFKVTGIIEDMPAQSHFNYDFLASFSSVPVGKGILLREWGWNPCWTYVLLSKNVKPETLKEKFKDFSKKYMPESIGMYSTFDLQPLKDIHLRSLLEYEIEPNSNILYVFILLAIATFILIISLVNYFNLSIAFSHLRTKEIGVSKFVGANRGQLIWQFLIEAIVLCLLSAIISLILVITLLPAFNSLTTKTILYTDILNFNVLVSILLFSVFVGVLSGLYPALFLSAMQPLKIMRVSLISQKSNGISRNILMVVQFFIAITIIFATIISHKQTSYLLTKELGFTKDNIIILDAKNSRIQNQYESFKEELLSIAGIEGVTNMQFEPGVNFNSLQFLVFGLPLENNEINTSVSRVGYDFLNVFGLQIVAGRDFSKDHLSDREGATIVNEALVKKFESNNEKILGVEFRNGWGIGRCVGVIKNFNYATLHKPIGSMILVLSKPEFDRIDYVAIKTTNKNVNVLKRIELVWTKFCPESPFNYTYLSDDINKIYKNENKLNKIFLIFSILSLCITFLGVVGLASFITNRRKKEIGIRKVLGTPLNSIILILSKEFIFLVLISGLLAWPVSYYFLNQWLQNFAYKTEISLFIFVLTSLLVLVVTLFISGYYAFKVALIKPAISLKNE